MKEFENGHVGENLNNKDENNKSDMLDEFDFGELSEDIRCQHQPNYCSQVPGQTTTYNRNRTNLYKKFLTDYTPSKIEEKLNARIIGQSELTKTAADFLYYHVLRQIKPELPPRPMLISGPSGSGKTEVWRVVKTLFKDVVNVEIIDGASITQEGYKGNNKLSYHIDEEIANGGILVVDEFDKLAAPECPNGTNIAARLQSEFLKLLEGEYTKKKDNKGSATIRYVPGLPIQGSSNASIDTKRMGIVLVGAFENIREKKENRVGFGHKNAQTLSCCKHISDEEYIEFGVIPELIGRVATKTTTNQLTDDEYVQIIYNPYSRVSVIVNTFKEFGVNLDGLVDKEDVRALIKRAKSNKTGVRWVSAQIEGRLLEAIRNINIGSLIKCDETKIYPIDDSDSSLEVDGTVELLF